MKSVIQSRNKREGHYWGISLMYESRGYGWKQVMKKHYRGPGKMPKLG